MRAKSARLLGGFLALWVGLPAGAHQSGASRMEVHARLDDGEVDLLLALPAKDLGSHLGFDPGNLEAGQERVTRYLRSRVLVRGDGQRCLPTGDAVVKFSAGKRHILVLETLNCPSLSRRLELRNFALFETGPYTHHARVQVGEAIYRTLFSAATPRFTLELAEPPSVVPSMGRYLWEGVRHIVLGYDHVLFVVCLLLVAPGLRGLLLLVTAFTVAHTLTLVMSALEWVSLPPGLVEPAIAASILWVAIENILSTRGERPGPRHRYRLTFAFGLLHGFGFSSVLRDEVGLPTQALVPALVSFNVGVELGQMAIVLIAWPLIRLAARQGWWRRAMWSLSALVSVLALYWLVVRIWASFAAGGAS